ncbi:isoflavone reductase family protein [Paraphoma chrysanthemicola]|uniref:Isoflavone reductase family protein n=1 Tax=Paraphoma chrysanthemicola TaxID=798071 RepID=A0A8K0R134_9PLEO|nr:isoflavone reductase family protein [Paraphoma chrysanthemicola]
MTTEKIIVIGNWDLCLTIVNTLIPIAFKGDHVRCRLLVLTYPSQTLDLPPHVSPYTVEHKKSDFSSSSLQDVFGGQDIVISTMSGGDSDLQIRIIDAAIAAGVKKFIPHEFGHDTLNKDLQARISKYAGRAKVLEHLQQLSNDHPHFEWAGIATGYPLDTELINGNMGFDMKWYSATVHGIGTEPFAASSLERVGQVVAKVVQHWSEVKNQYIYAAGVITSANEVLRAAERATGHEWTVGNHDVEDSVREGEARIQRGFPDAGMALLERSVLYDERLDASANFKSRSANKLLQLSTESVNDIVRKAYHDLQNHGKPGCGCST